MESLRERLRRARIPVGFVLGFFFLLTARPSWGTIAWGSVVSLVGVGIRTWALGHLEKDTELATAGPYAFTRNPLYLGNLLIGMGLSMAAGRGIHLLLFLIYFSAIYPATIKAEEAHLQELFGDRFSVYRSQVPVIFPRLESYRTSRSGDFQWNRYWAHREYRVVLGFLIVLLILGGRMWINAHWQL